MPFASPSCSTVLFLSSLPSASPWPGSNSHPSRPSTSLLSSPRPCPPISSTSSVPPPTLSASTHLPPTPASAATHLSFENAGFRTSSASTRARISHARRGRRHSAATRDAIRRSALDRASARRREGLPGLSEETRRKISEAQLGRVPSEETRARMRAAARRVWEGRREGRGGGGLVVGVRGGDVEEEVEDDDDEDEERKEEVSDAALDPVAKEATVSDDDEKGAEDASSRNRDDEKEEQQQQLADVDSEDDRRSAETDKPAVRKSRRTRRLPMSDETKQKIRAALLGRKHTDQRKQRIAASMKGKKKSPSHIAAMSRSKRGKGNPLYGRTHSEETRMKMSQALRMSARRRRAGASGAAQEMRVAETVRKKSISAEDNEEHDDLMEIISRKLAEQTLELRATQRAKSEMAIRSERPRHDVCTSCGGQGMVQCPCSATSATNAQCPRCVGSGILFCMDCDGAGVKTIR